MLLLTSTAIIDDCIYSLPFYRGFETAYKILCPQRQLREVEKDRGKTHVEIDRKTGRSVYTWIGDKFMSSNLFVFEQFCSTFI